MVPGMETLAQIVNSILSLALITVLFAMIFKFLPDAKVAWHDVWIGAFITAVLFTVGKLVLESILEKAALALPTAQQAHSLSCSYGFIIPRRSFFSERSSPRFMQADSAHTWLLPTMRLPFRATLKRSDDAAGRSASVRRKGSYFRESRARSGHPFAAL